MTSERVALLLSKLSNKTVRAILTEWLDAKRMKYDNSELLIVEFIFTRLFDMKHEILGEDAEIAEETD